MNAANDPWEAALRKTVAAFSYPPTPDIATGVSERLAAPPPRWTRRKLAFAVVLLTVLLAGLLAVSPVRAALAKIFRAGAITIFVDEPTATANVPTPVSEVEPGLTPTLPPLESAVTELAGRTTLAQTQAEVDFPLLIPPGYGLPDEVYLQKSPDVGLDGEVAFAVMVWVDPAQPGQARLRLYQIGAAYFGLKEATMAAVLETEVNGEPAYWIEGGHRILLPSGGEQGSYLVERNVLIWVEGPVTYRLEGELSAEEAVRIAESLEELP